MKIQKEKIVAGALTALLFGSIISSMVLFRNNSRLNDGISEEKLRTESLINEKAALTREIDKLKKEISLAEVKNTGNERLLTEMMDQLTAKENRIALLQKENKTVKELRQEIAHLQQIKSDLEKQAGLLMAENSGLKEDYSQLQNHMNTLKAENAILIADLELMKLASADKYLIQSIKGKKKERLTIHANQARKLAVSFDLPQDVMADLKFKVVTPSGRKVDEGNKEISWNVPGDLEMLTASLNGMGGEIRVTRRVEMTYQPKGKMEKGVYTITVMNGNNYIGSCQIRLR